MSLHNQSIIDEMDNHNKCQVWEFVPLIICLCILFAIVLYVCIDYKGSIKLFYDMIKYIRNNPYEAIAIIVAIYIFLVIFILPIMQMHFVVAFAYCKVYNSFWIGFAVATPIIFIGCMLGAFFAIILSKYLIANFIKK